MADRLRLTLSGEWSGKAGTLFSGLIFSYCKNTVRDIQTGDDNGTAGGLYYPEKE
jgi:hypothetical protein